MGVSFDLGSIERHAIPSWQTMQTEERSRLWYTRIELKHMKVEVKQLVKQPTCNLAELLEEGLSRYTREGGMLRRYTVEEHWEKVFAHFDRPPLRRSRSMEEDGHVQRRRGGRRRHRSNDGTIQRTNSMDTTSTPSRPSKHFVASESPRSTAVHFSVLMMDRERCFI